MLHFINAHANMNVTLASLLRFGLERWAVLLEESGCGSAKDMFEIRLPFWFVKCFIDNL